jgi:hypothetical protein
MTREDHSDHHPSHLSTPDSEPVIAPLSPQGRPPPLPHRAGRIALLATLAGVLVAAIVGTTAVLVHDRQGSQTAGTTKTTVQVAGTATRTSALPTPFPTDPRSNGWMPVSGGNFADVQFSAGGVASVATSAA